MKPKIRAYLNNELITYILRSVQKKNSKNPFVSMQTTSLLHLSNIKSIEVEFLVSEESLAEIRKLSEHSLKRKDLETQYFKLKQSKSVIRNSAVRWDDPIATWSSPDVYYDHPYTDSDLNTVKSFLQSKGNDNDFDARYVANAMLPENKISFLLTADKKTIWVHRKELKERFGVDIKLPSELAEYLKHIR